MKSYKWRIVLSLVNLVAAIGLSALGPREYETFRRAHTHSDATVPYIPTAQLVSYCMNTPSFVLSNLLGNVGAWRMFWEERWLGGYWFQHVSVTFFLFVLLFWWWVGWRVDAQPRPIDRTELAARLGWLTGAIGALVLCFISVGLLRERLPALYAYQDSVIVISMLLWGLALVCYFSLMLFRAART
jgi:hypothetical protein